MGNVCQKDWMTPTLVSVAIFLAVVVPLTFARSVEKKRHQALEACASSCFPSVSTLFNEECYCARENGSWTNP